MIGADAYTTFAVPSHISECLPHQPDDPTVALLKSGVLSCRTHDPALATYTAAAATWSMGFCSDSTKINVLIFVSKAAMS